MNRPDHYRPTNRPQNLVRKTGLPIILILLATSLNVLADNPPPANATSGNPASEFRLPDATEYKSSYNYFIQQLSGQSHHSLNSAKPVPMLLASGQTISFNQSSITAPLENGNGSQVGILYKDALAEYKTELSTYRMQIVAANQKQLAYNTAYNTALNALQQRALAWDAAHSCGPELTCTYPEAIDQRIVADIASPSQESLFDLNQIGNEYPTAGFCPYNSVTGQGALFAAAVSGFNFVYPDEPTVNYPPAPDFDDIYARYLAYYSSWKDLTFIQDSSIKSPPDLKLTSGCPKGESMGPNSRGGVQCVKTDTLTKALLIKYNPKYQSTAMKPATIAQPDFKSEGSDIQTPGNGAPTASSALPVPPPVPTSSPSPLPKPRPLGT